MNTYIALLRGINVGGHKKIKMADLRTSLKTKGFLEIQTYIQSGNLVFRYDETPANCEIKIASCIEKEFGFEVPTIVVSHSNFKEIVVNNPFSGEQVKETYYTILSRFPEKEMIADFETIKYTDGQIILQERCVYYHAAKGFGKSKYSNNLVEKMLKLNATTRNHRTMIKILELAESISF